MVIKILFIKEFHQPFFQHCYVPLLCRILQPSHDSHDKFRHIILLHLPKSEIKRPGGTKGIRHHSHMMFYNVLYVLVLRISMRLHIM